MKITTFNPMIVTKDAESLIKLFEELGFERRHKKTGINDEDISTVRMRYTGEDGKVFHVDISQAPVPQDIPTIRMNIDNFDEAYKLLEENGFKNAQGERITETGSSRSTMMVSPSGYTINISQHIKKPEWYRGVYEDNIIYPSIVTKDAETVMKHFEKLWFERTHTKTDVSEDDVTVHRMKNENGSCLDVVQNDNVDRDISAIRMNVDYFDAAYGFLTARGFKNMNSDITETSSSRSAVMFSPSGAGIALIQHIRK